MVYRKQVFLECSPNVVGGLIEAATTALMEDFPRTSVNLDDVEMMLEALHALRPNTLELHTLDGLLHVVRGQWHDAIRILRTVSDGLPGFGYARALLSLSLSATGDRTWRQCADEVLASDASRSVKALAMAVVARNDMLDAIRASRLGADFVPPESMTALQELTRLEDAFAAGQSDAREDSLLPHTSGTFVRV